MQPNFYEGTLSSLSLIISLKSDEFYSKYFAIYCKKGVSLLYILIYILTKAGGSDAPATLPIMSKLRFGETESFNVKLACSILYSNIVETLTKLAFKVFHERNDWDNQTI